MKNRLFVAALAMITSISFAAQAQTTKTQKAANAASSIYVISAKAGAVNFVSGEVNILQKGAKVTGKLVKTDEIETGDRVITGANGRAEILMNPGSFMRVGENSEFEFVSTKLDNLEIKLDKGAAIFEVITVDRFKIKIQTPKSDFYLLRSGVYRIDVQPDGSGRMSVWKGRAQTGDGKTAVLKGGQSVVSDGRNSTVAKFDRDDKTELDLWSKERAKEIAKANAKLIRNHMNQALFSSYRNNQWNMYSSFGLWVQDSWTRSFCFLPFGYGWSSPYGYGFNSSVWNYTLPPGAYQNPYVINNGQAPSPPPYQQIPSNGGNSGGGNQGSGSNPPPPPPVQPPVEIPRMPTIVERKDSDARPVTPVRDN